MADKLIHYVGPSMNPTLSVGDGLNVVPYGTHPICVGDVVVFAHPDGKQNVVHRVVRVDRTGIRTRGDNNNEDDPWTLSPEQIQGRVVSIGTGSQSRPLATGWHGQAQASAVRQWNRTRKWARLQFSRFFHPVYRSLSSGGLFRRCLGSRFPSHVVKYQRSRGVELVVIVAGRVVGKWDPVAQQWRIRAPWRLLVDESALPQDRAATGFDP
ncbi:MAG: S26 family signal peptidase [Verrucomicrobia bacterium]|nr:S26 family signal peptidase [Verrucomicrobiota bacterium]